MIRSYKYFTHTGSYVFSLTNVKISFKILIGGKSIVRCCMYMTTYDWIKSFLKVTIEGRAKQGKLENKINTLYWPVENSISQVTAALCNILLHNLTLTCPK